MPPAGQRLPGNDNHEVCWSTRDGLFGLAGATGLASWKDGRLTPYAELECASLLRTAVKIGKERVGGRVGNARWETL